MRDSDRQLSFSFSRLFYRPLSKADSRTPAILVDELDAGGFDGAADSEISGAHWDLRRSRSVAYEIEQVHPGTSIWVDANCERRAIRAAL